VKYTRLLPLPFILALTFPALAQTNTRTPFQFADATASAGLAPALANWELGHAAAWGDVNNDGRLDLFFGSFADRPVYFASNPPLPNMLWLGTSNGFVRSEQPALEMRGLGNRISSSVFADLDNDGDLDLILGQHVQEITDDPDQQKAAGIPWGGSSTMFENTGAGVFRKVPDSGPWPPRIGARNIAPIDVDQDGKLDLLIGDGSYGPKTNAHLRLLRNLGGFRFEDASARFGLPPSGTFSLGLAMGDINEDGRVDFFMAGCNRLFLSATNGGFREAAFKPLERIYINRKDRNGFYCGAAFGDLNGDGRLDLVVTLHSLPARIYVLFNESADPETPLFVDRSAELGLEKRFPTALPSNAVMKSAHVELRDMDNDGRLDIALAAYFTNSEGRLQPIVLHNLGNGTNGLARFSDLPLDRMAGYCAPGPVSDYDGDGRLDMFLPSWFRRDQVPTLLFRNVTPGGHYLTVRVRDGKGRLNPMGIGAVVRAYKAGGAGDPARFIQRGDLVTGFGYACGQEAAVHLGLGAETNCDLVVSWEGMRKVFKSVAADQVFNAVVE
jgi:hypothetical protein